MTLRTLRLSTALSLSLGLLAAPAAGAAEKPAAKKVAPAKAAAAQKPKKGAGRHLPFVEGDYEKALADAKARNVPLVVDVWAPW